MAEVKFEDSLGDYLEVSVGHGQFLFEVFDQEKNSGEGVNALMVLDFEYVGKLVSFLVTEMYKRQDTQKYEYLRRALTAENHEKDLQEQLDRR